MSETTTYTAQQIEDMRTAVAAADRAATLAHAAEEAEALRQLREFTTSADYQTILIALPAIAASYRNDPRFQAFLDCLSTGMPALANVAGPLPVDPAPDA